MSSTAKVDRLKLHVSDAKKTLLTHQSHVEEIKKLMENAEGE